VSAGARWWCTAALVCAATFLPVAARAQADAGASLIIDGAADATVADASLDAAMSPDAGDDSSRDGNADGARRPPANPADTEGEEVVSLHPTGTAHPAIFLQPIATVVVASIEGRFAISLGGQVPFIPQTEFFTDATFVYGANTDRMLIPATSSAITQWTGRLGILRTFGGWIQNGPYILPNITYVIRNSNDTLQSVPPGAAQDFIEGELGIGLEIGWQIVSGPVLVAVNFGGSINMCFDCVHYVRTGPGLAAYDRTRDNHIMVRWTQNVFRVGIAF
jgi:hypothetical protein